MTQTSRRVIFSAMCAAVIVLAACGSASTESSPRAARSAPTSTEPGPIRPPRRVSSRRPTQVVGGPLLFRATDRYYTGSKYVAGTAYVLVFKLNRDPLVRTPGENSFHGRGEYAVDKFDIADDGGIAKSAGKYCFVGAFLPPGTGGPQRGLGRFKIGDPVRIEMQPRKAKPSGRTFLFDVPLLKGGPTTLSDAASTRELKNIGCGNPDI